MILVIMFLFFQNAHPYFNRVSYSEGARYYSEGAYMASHHWDKVVSHLRQYIMIIGNWLEAVLTDDCRPLQIVIKDSSHPIPVEMYNGFEAHGVKIVLEVGIIFRKALHN